MFIFDCIELFLTFFSNFLFVICNFLFWLFQIVFSFSQYFSVYFNIFQLFFLPIFLCSPLRRQFYLANFFQYFSRILSYPSFSDFLGKCFLSFPKIFQSFLPVFYPVFFDDFLCHIPKFFQLFPYFLSRKMLGKLQLGFEKILYFFVHFFFNFPKSLMLLTCSTCNLLFFLYFFSRLNEKTGSILWIKKKIK